MCREQGEKTSLKQRACERIHIFISVRLKVGSRAGLGDDDNDDDDDDLIIVVGKRYIVVAGEMAIFK